MSEKVVMKHPNLGDVRRTVTRKQFAIWEQSGWKEDTTATNKLAKDAEERAKLNEKANPPAPEPEAASE